MMNEMYTENNTLEFPLDYENYDIAKEHLMIRLCGIEGKEEQLNRMPFTVKEDMAITYNLMVNTDKNTSYIMPVTNNVFEKYGISIERLHDDAVANTEKLLQPVIRPMEELLFAGPDSEIKTGASFDRQLESLRFEGPELYVLTNEKSYQGAAVIEYQGILDKIAERAQRNLIILPSSIHEVILLPDDGYLKYKDLEQMVWDINRTQVLPEDVLSDSVYHYDRKSMLFERAEDFAARIRGEKPLERKAEVPAVDKDNSRVSIKEQLKDAAIESGKQEVKAAGKKEPALS